MFGDYFDNYGADDPGVARDFPEALARRHGSFAAGLRALGISLRPANAADPSVPPDDFDAYDRAAAAEELERLRLAAGSVH